MSSKLVERRLNDFKRRCGKDGDAALQLAYHAAMPVALNSELLHFLRINFFLDPPEQLPYTVEFEFLTSGLCREIDAELYEIEPEIRNELLQELMRREDARQRIRDVATLLWQYVEYHSPWADRVELERAQQLTALNFLDPAKAQEWLDEAEANGSLGRGEREWFIAMRQEIEDFPTFPPKVTLRPLKAKQFQQLQQALLSAFPNRATLKQMVRFGLDENLDAIAIGENDEEAVFKLIDWAETSGNLENLLIAARNEDCGGNPSNSQLKRICAELLQGHQSQPYFDVFLAHNSLDKPQVREIAQKLKDRDLKPWLDEEQIRPGLPFQDEIQEAIPRAKSAAIFLGLQGLGSWQSWELRALISSCVKKKIPVIPILLPGVSTLPEHLVFLKEFRWVEFAQEIDDAFALDLLEWGITGQKPTQVSNSTEKPGLVPDDLSSDRNVDYTQLRNLLAAGNWKDADYETYLVMLRVVGRELGDWIRPEELLNFPCTDLRTIDSLWVRYSNGRFGFSVQKRIWQSVGGKPNADYETFEKFGDYVGWLVKNKLLDHKDLQFHLNAPLGHLPSHIDLIGFDSLGGSLFSRVQTCEVEARKVSENG